MPTVVTTVETTVPDDRAHDGPDDVPDGHAHDRGDDRGHHGHHREADRVPDRHGVSAGIPIYDTPTVNETPTTLRTLPQPLPHDANLTEEPTEEWPFDETPTVTQTLFVVRGTPTKSVVNNTSALAASATGGSGFGDAWMYALAAIAGVGLVALGVVVIRRGRDDDL